MRNKKLINRRNNITQYGSSAVGLGKGRGGGGGGEREKKLLQHGVFVFGHPSNYTSTNLNEQGLTLMSGRYLLLSLWYSDSTLF